VDVSSLGTLDLGTVPPLPEALELGASLGIDLSEHRTHKLSGNDLSRADLVIGFERMHVITSLVDGGARRERAFTLPELLSLLHEPEPSPTGNPLERAAAVLAVAQARRPADPELIGRPELADPIGGSPETYRRTAETLLEQTQRLAALLFGRTTAAAEPETG
jgi:protein-tyrosine phosphatase